jgi:hypothetical protein
MTRRRWALALFGLSLVALVTFFWLIPTVRGPVVECQGIDAPTCDRVWRAAAASSSGILAILPVTYARVAGGSCSNEVWLEWLGGALGMYQESFC